MSKAYQFCIWHCISKPNSFSLCRTWPWKNKHDRIVHRELKYSDSPLPLNSIPSIFHNTSLFDHRPNVPSLSSVIGVMGLLCWWAVHCLLCRAVSCCWSNVFKLGEQRRQVCPSWFDEKLIFLSSCSLTMLSLRIRRTRKNYKELGISSIFTVTWETIA